MGGLRPWKTLCACSPSMFLASLLSHRLMSKGTNRTLHLCGSSSVSHPLSWRAVRVKGVGEVTEVVHVGKAEQLTPPGDHHIQATAVGSLLTTGLWICAWKGPICYFCAHKGPRKKRRALKQILCNLHWCWSFPFVEYGQAEVENKITITFTVDVPIGGRVLFSLITPL